jgi:hypothetical protein
MLFSDWMSKKYLSKDFTAKEKESNKALQEIIEQQVGGNLAFTDDKGHQWLDLGAEIEGYDSKGAPAKFNAIQRQRRVSLVVDEEEAVKRLEKKDLLPEASTSYLQVHDVDKAIAVLAKAKLLDGETFEVTTSISEDKITALYFEDKITKEDYEAIVTEKVTWALLPGTLS